MFTSFSSALLDRASRRARTHAEAATAAAESPAAASALSHVGRFLVEHATPFHPQSEAIMHLARTRETAPRETVAAPAACTRCDNGSLVERLAGAFGLITRRSCDCGEGAA